MIVIEVRRVNDRVMSLAMAFEEVVSVVCACVPQGGKSTNFFRKTNQENGPLIKPVN